MACEVTVREIEAEDGDAGFDEFAHVFGAVACGADGGDDGRERIGGGNVCDAGIIEWRKLFHAWTISVVSHPVRYRTSCSRLTFCMPSASELAQYLALSEQALLQGRLALAELGTQLAIAADERSPAAWNAFGRIAARVEQFAVARQAFERAIAIDAYFKPAVKNLKALPTQSKPRSDQRYLVIREWGAGFWSDVDHVVSGILLARLTERTPIVWWGRTSLFHDVSVANAWEIYFEPLSSVQPTEIAGLPTWPGKWNGDPFADVQNRFAGLDSRITAVCHMERAEAVCVSDFMTDVFMLRRWVLPSDALAGKSAREVIARLAEEHIKPRAVFREQAAAFVRENFGTKTIAVHLRGLDKSVELGVEAMANAHLAAIAKLDATLVSHPAAKVLLLTDDNAVLAMMQRKYAERLIVTDATRAVGSAGLHLSQQHDGRKLAEEVLVDVCIALHADRFIGLAGSNVSYYIASMKDWGENCDLFGPALHNDFGIALSTLTA